MSVPNGTAQHIPGTVPAYPTWVVGIAQAGAGKKSQREASARVSFAVQRYARGEAPSRILLYSLNTTHHVCRINGNILPVPRCSCTGDIPTRPSHVPQHLYFALPWVAARLGR